MLKSKLCLKFIEKSVEHFQAENQVEYRLYSDSRADFKAKEIAIIMYPSIMLLADNEAQKLGFEGSHIQYKMEQPRNKALFPLKAVTEPKTEMSFLLPFLEDVCKYKLAQQPVMSNIFEQAVKTVVPNFQISQIMKLQPSENFFIPHHPTPD